MRTTLHQAFRVSCSTSRQAPPAHQGRGHPGGAADQVRAGDQPKDGEGTWFDNSRIIAASRRRGDRIKAKSVRGAKAAYELGPSNPRSNSLKGVPTVQNSLLRSSMRGFGCDLSEKPLKNLVKASDFQAEYGFAGAA